MLPIQSRRCWGNSLNRKNGNSILIYLNFRARLERRAELDETIFGKKEEAFQNIHEEILDSGRLFVRNLPYICNEEDLKGIFKKYGEIAELQVIIDKKTGKCKGFAIVTFIFPENALEAYKALDGTIFKVIIGFKD